jgi:hypothetical protein
MASFKAANRIISKVLLMRPSENGHSKPVAWQLQHLRGSRAGTPRREKVDNATKHLMD